MNENQQLEDLDIVPDWAWDLIEKHDLGIRADCPMAAVSVLLHDAAVMLKDLEETSFREQAVTGDLRGKLNHCEAMISDAVTPAALCPSTPEPGTVVVLEDGTRQWSPAGRG